jgi:hypothetical protein
MSRLVAIVDLAAFEMQQEIVNEYLLVPGQSDQLNNRSITAETY